MAKRGRKPKMQNPYDLKDEANHQTWQHGFGSLTKEDNPYTSDSEPELNTVWLTGYNAKKKKPSEKAVKAPPEGEDEVPSNPPTQALEASGQGNLIAQVSTADLEAELLKRKLDVIKDLNKKKQELILQFHNIEATLQRLAILTGEVQQ